MSRLSNHLVRVAIAAGTLGLLGGCPTPPPNPPKPTPTPTAPSSPGVATPEELAIARQQIENLVHDGEISEFFKLDLINDGGVLYMNTQGGPNLQGLQTLATAPQQIQLPKRWGRRIEPEAAKRAEVQVPSAATGAAPMLPAPVATQAPASAPIPAPTSNAQDSAAVLPYSTPKEVVVAFTNAAGTAADIRVQATRAGSIEIDPGDGSDQSLAITERYIRYARLRKIQNKWLMTLVSPVELASTSLLSEKPSLDIARVLISVDGQPVKELIRPDRDLDKVPVFPIGSVIRIEIQPTIADETYDPPFLAYFHQPSKNRHERMLDDGNNSLLSGDPIANDGYFAYSFIAEQEEGFQTIALDVISTASLISGKTSGYQSKTWAINYATAKP